MHSKKPQEGNLYSCQILLEQNKKFQKSTMSISYQIFYKKNPQKNIWQAFEEHEYNSDAQKETI